jgi:hypothetical protein
MVQVSALIRPEMRVEIDGTPAPLRTIHRFKLDPVAPNAQRTQASSITT